MNKGWLIWGAALAFCAVATGALGDHLMQANLRLWFPDDFERRLSNWEVASRYLFFHALAICLIGVLPRQVPRSGVHIAGIFFTCGVLLFSGCLFGYVCTDVKPLVRLVPLGGVSFLLGWLSFIWAVARTDRTTQ